MIHVNKSQLKQVEYLIGQSIQGNHILFDNDTIRRAFDDGLPPLEVADGYAIEPYIEKLILQPSLEEKRAFLEGLSPELYAQLVRTYFNIVENNLFEAAGARH